MTERILKQDRRSLRDCTQKYGLGILMLPHLVKNLQGTQFCKREDTKFKMGFIVPLVQADMEPSVQSFTLSGKTEEIRAVKTPIVKSHNRIMETLAPKLGTPQLIPQENIESINHVIPEMKILSSTKIDTQPAHLHLPNKL